MAHEKREKKPPPARNTREGDTADDDPSTRRSGTDTEPDHSEREWGGDQDIDTAGMIPGNKVTDTP